MRLTVTDIAFSYNSHPVLSEVNFELEKGQFMCILGVNGAGKSTLLKCLNRILKPARGAILVEGDDLLRMKRKQIAKRMGYVPQRHSEMQMTVFETILMGRKPHMNWSMGKMDYQVTESILGKLNLTHLALRQVNRLSGGELQKVIIGRALAQSPDILLFDEPTSNLDLKNQLEVMALIQKIVREQQMVAIVAIHDLNMALRFADRFLLLKGGMIQAASGLEHLTPEMIRHVYGVDVMLKKINNHWVVIPV